MNGSTYRIENLDVYRKSMAAGVKLYRAAGNGASNGHSPLAEKVRQTALAMILHLVDGLGFWETDIKALHFAAAKRAVNEMTPLLDLMVSLGEMKPETQAQLATDLQDLAKMVGGLLRQARRREQGGEEARGAQGEERGREGACN